MENRATVSSFRNMSQANNINNNNNINDNSNSNNKQTSEEDDVLASLQASLRNQSAYEEEVIREATHALAPPLPTLGLPPLEGLSTVGIVPTVQVHQVLHQVRQPQPQVQRQHGNDDDHNHNNNKAAAASTRTTTTPPLQPMTDLNCFKEQILLHYLETVCGIPQREEEEQGRGLSLPEQRRLARRQAHLLDQSRHLHPPPHSSQEQPQQSLAAKKNTLQQPSAPRRNKNHDNSHDNDDNNDQDDQSHRPTKRRRRQVQRIVDEHEDPLLMTAQQRQALATRRLERQARKLARRQGRQVQTSETNEHNNNDFDENDPEVEWGDNGQDEETKQEAKSLVIHETTTATITTVSTESTSSDHPLICPLCNNTVEILDGPATAHERDARLAYHMQNECGTEAEQGMVGGGGRPRRSTRQRHTVMQVDSILPYNDVDDRDDDDDDGKHDYKDHVVAATVTRKVITTKIMAPAVDDLDEDDYEDRVDDWIAHGLGRMKEMKERIVDHHTDIDGKELVDHGPWQEYGPGFFVPAWIHRRLFGYQREGLQWMWGLHQQGCGGCLGDEMGLGKTVSVSSYLGALISNRKIKSVLIVVPATMLQHWLKELAIWAPGLRRVLIHTSGEVDGRSRAISSKLLNSLAKWLQQSRKDRLYEAIGAEDEETNPPHSFCGTGYAVLTTYENVRRNPDVYAAHSWSYVVLDEAQKIRNPEADVTIAMKQLRTSHRICMTGTPIQNDFSELWSIFDFCFPSRLGTLAAFQAELADPIKRGGYSNATPMQVQLAYRCALVVRDLISPYLLRRQKKDVREVSMMPAKTEHVLFCRLSEIQRSMYEAFLQSDEVSKVMRGSTNLLGAVITLRKICNHPDLICDPSSVNSLLSNGFKLTSINYEIESDEDSDYDGDLSVTERSGKLEVLSKILPLWKKQGHRVLIFCQWRKMLNIIQTFVTNQGWKFGRLDGNTSVAARQRLVDNFNEDTSYFGLLCTTRTGGVGLNLTGANRIILYDPDWNPQTDAQARERAWRFGQEKEVTIYRLITAGTVEEKIYQRQIFKTALSNRVLQDPRQRRLFSQRDLRDLFTLKADTGSVRSGGDGATDTALYTRGIGVVDPNADMGAAGDSDDDKNQDDNQDTLKTVLKSKGLAGVFDHHFVEQDASRKSTTVREMEAKAKQVAKAAMVALRQSVGEEGSAPNEPQRFGGDGIASNAASSSKSLLAGLRQRNDARAASGNVDAAVDQEAIKYSKLMKTVREYVRRRRPTTDELLAEFDGSVLSSDAAIFKRLLHSVAVMQSGRWRPKD